MQPLIAPMRAYVPGGLWTPKLGGKISEGDSKRTSHIIEGKVEIKEFSNNLKIFFNGINIKKRIKILNDEERKVIGDAYKLSQLKKRKEKRKIQGKDPDSDSETEDDMIKREKVEDEEILKLIHEEETKEIPIPKLYTYLVRIKPKAKMSGAHKIGSKIHLLSNKDGLFGRDGTTDNFSCSLKDIPDALAYQGLVILKLPGDTPKTEDSIIFGYSKLESARGITFIHNANINTNTNSNTYINTNTNTNAYANTNTITIIIGTNTNTNTNTNSNIGKKAKTADAVEITEVGLILSKIIESQNPEHSKQNKVEKSIKPTSFYRKLADRAWDSLAKTYDEEINFEIFTTMLDTSGVYLTHPQAKRLFDKVELQGDGNLGMSEFENFLMAYDVLGQAPEDILAMDVYDSFKFVNDPNFAEMGIKGDGMDYSAFIEGCQMLGAVVKDDLLYQKAFCSASGKSVRFIDSTYLTHEQFKKGWLQVANIDSELKKRGFKSDLSSLAPGRNKDRIYRSVTDIETVYLANLETINGIVDEVKRRRRQKKDDAKSARQAIIDSIQLKVKAFISVRAQEERLLAREQAEEKQKKRLEEKNLRQKLMDQQKENRKKKDSAMAEEVMKQEKLRNDQIRAQGLDRLDISVRGWREIPLELYHTTDAQTKLSYVMLLDISRNKLDRLPDSNFLYWLADTRQMNLSQNRLTSLPNELEKMLSLEILELDSNRLNSLPDGISVLTCLQRLDISNNNIQALPANLGSCGNLKYFNAHSNNLLFLPDSIGSCFRLQYVDLSKNKLKELPSEIEHCASLTYLNLSVNRIGHLPNNFGKCTQLTYLNMENNELAFLPNTFSNLEKLEYCCLENNELVSVPNTFNNLISLKKLELKRNHCKNLFPDIGGSRNLMLLDLSNNKITNIPIEIGLLNYLQELRLSDNQIKHIPPEVGSCRILRKLELMHNHLEGCLPETIGLVQSLVDLNISFNEIDSLPRSIIGLKQLVSIRAEKCLMSSLPDTITYLDTLELLDISNNRFTRFPLELSAMKSLKILNLSNNAIPLLQKEIYTMTNVSHINLCRNRLRALPIEFVEIFESVPEVLIDGNPWTDYPPRWGKIWPGQKKTEAPMGYNVGEAVDFLYGMKPFYDVAESVWGDYGALHYSNRLNFNDFIQEIRSRIPNTWNEGFIESAKFIYFTSLESGVFPRWYELSTPIVRENNARIAYDVQKRELNVQRTRKAAEERKARTEAAYTIDLSRKVKRAEEISDEHMMNEKILNNAEMLALHNICEQREKAALKRIARREKKIAKDNYDEMKRLKEIVRADQEIFKAEKAESK